MWSAHGSWRLHRAHCRRVCIVAVTECLKGFAIFSPPCLLLLLPSVSSCFDCLLLKGRTSESAKFSLLSWKATNRFGERMEKEIKRRTAASQPTAALRELWLSTADWMRGLRTCPELVFLLPLSSFPLLLFLLVVYFFAGGTSRLDYCWGGFINRAQGSSSYLSVRKKAPH